MRLVDWIICVFTKNEAVTQDRTPRSSKRVRSKRDRAREREIHLYGICCLYYFYDRLINHGQVPCVTRVVSACCI